MAVLQAVIYNNEAGALSGTLGTTNISIPTVGISDTDGADALGAIGQSATVALGAGGLHKFQWYFNGNILMSWVSRHWYGAIYQSVQTTRSAMR